LVSVDAREKSNGRSTHASEAISSWQVDDIEERMQFLRWRFMESERLLDGDLRSGAVRHTDSVEQR
jgi:hypothetical protein